MIYTITFNPAVDLVIRAGDVKLGDLNRSTGEDYVAGGKGINMSFVLNRLGLQNTAVAFLGGFTGDYIERSLKAENITVKRFDVNGITRVNVKLKGTQETEINANGPEVSNALFQTLINYFQQTLQVNDYVFLAGNKAPGMNADNYVAIAQLCQEKGAHLVLDTTKDLLTQCLPYKPFIIKPNHHELGDIFDVTVTSDTEIIQYAKKLQELGAVNVLISKGGDGSLLVADEGSVYKANVPKGKLVNSVGAGDSMLAGFISEYIQTSDYEKALKKGAATGSATAFSVGIAEVSLVQELLPQIRVEKIN